VVCLFLYEIKNPDRKCATKYKYLSASYQHRFKFSYMVIDMHSRKFDLFSSSIFSFVDKDIATRTQVSHKNKSGRIYAASLAFCIFYVRVESAFYSQIVVQNGCYCCATHCSQLPLLLLLILLISCFLYSLFFLFLVQFWLLHADRA